MTLNQLQYFYQAAKTQHRPIANAVMNSAIIRFLRFLILILMTHSCPILYYNIFIIRQNAGRIKIFL